MLAATISSAQVLLGFPQRCNPHLLYAAQAIFSSICIAFDPASKLHLMCCVNCCTRTLGSWSFFSYIGILLLLFSAAFNSPFLQISFASGISFHFNHHHFADRAELSLLKRPYWTVFALFLFQPFCTSPRSAVRLQLVCLPTSGTSIFSYLAPAPLLDCFCNHPHFNVLIHAALSLEFYSCFLQSDSWHRSLSIVFYSLPPRFALHVLLVYLVFIVFLLLRSA